MDLRKLDCDVISKIRSSFSISSVAQCVFELVSNSLDAKSTSVAVRLNLVTFKIQVADNGDGITRENMELLGVRYTTNKCRTMADLEKTLKTYGFRGEAIANIVEMSKSVSINSRFKTSDETYNKILSKEKSELKLSKQRASVGTTVTVLGWLSSIPVRQQMTVPDIELAEVKKQLESFAIINPKTSFTLRNDVTGLLILNCSKTPDIVDSFRQLYPEINDSFTLFKVSKSKVSIEILIQKELVLSKKFQYIYVNKKPVASTRIRNHVLKAFHRKDSLKTKKSLLFNTKRYPVYLMNIKCPQSCVDSLCRPSKNDVEFTCWELVLACIDKITKTFLGLETDNKIPPPPPARGKFNCGISQLFGAVQASAFKRKSDEIQSDDDRNSHTSTSKVRKVDRKVTANPTAKVSQISENYGIEDSDKPVAPLKVRPTKKEPLAIKVQRKIFEHTIENPNPRQEGEGVDEQSVRQNQFDQRSLYSRLNTDEDRGKGLIMDMFLKSTQVFKGEVSEQTRADVSKETIEESNFLFENNMQDAAKGVNTTMSISVNVKRRRLKNTDDRKSKLASKYVQTTQKFADDGFYPFKAKRDFASSTNEVGNVDVRCEPTVFSRTYFKQEKFITKTAFADKPLEQPVIRRKSISTAPIYKPGDDVPEIVGSNRENRLSGRNSGLPRQKSYQTDLAARLNGFTLGPDNREGMKSDYTILINTVQKKREYVFVKKRDEAMEVTESPELMGFKPLKICHCDNDENIFKFQGEGTNGLLSVQENNADCQIPMFAQFPEDDKHITSKPIDYQVNPQFRKPMDYPKMLSKKTPVVNSEPLKLHFRGMTRYPAPNQQTKRLCSQSPYFRARLGENCVPRQSGFEKFHPLFKSTQISGGGFHLNVNNALSKGNSPFRTENRRYRIEEFQDDKENCKSRSVFARSNRCCLNPNQNIWRKEQNVHVNTIQPLHRQKLEEFQTNNVFGRVGIKHSSAGMGCCRNVIDFPKKYSCYDEVPRNMCPCNDRETEFNPIFLKNHGRNASFLNENVCCKPEYTHCHQVSQKTDKPVTLPNNKCIVEDSSGNDKSCHAMDITEPPWYTPIVSDENLYFETSDIEKNVTIVDTKVEPPKEKPFNFQPSCSPNIFTNDSALAQNSPLIIENSCDNEDEKGKFHALNTLCDLSDFGLTNRKNRPSKGSKLEISIPSVRGRRAIVEKELRKAQENSAHSKCEQKPRERSRIIVDSQNEWIRRINEDDKRFFVNKRTGMVTATTPNLTGNKFDFDERLDFVPKGMSPVLKEHKRVDRFLSQNAKSKLHELILEGYEDELMVIKWQNFVGDDPRRFFEEIYREKSKQFETCIPSVHDPTVKIPKDFISFTDQIFKNIDVIGQVDKKFIAVLDRSKNLLVLFDQHAVHERIRVEKFFEEYRGIKKACKEKLTIFTPNGDLNLLKKHSAYLQSLGLGFEFFKNGLHVTHMPVCIHEKFGNEDSREDLNKVLNILIKDIVELLRVTGGSSSNLMPKIIQNMLNLKACRGAIKFGDALSLQECANLLRDLPMCNLPFQCAHGRPTLTPLLTLTKVQPEIKNQAKKINFKKLVVGPTFF